MTYKQRLKYASVISALILSLALLVTACGLQSPGKADEQKLRAEISQLQAEKASLEEAYQALSGQEAPTEPAQEPVLTEAPRSGAETTPQETEFDSIFKGLTQEEKEKLPPVPMRVYIPGKDTYIEVTVPTSIKNLAEQEQYIRNINSKLSTVNMDKQEEETTWDGRYDVADKVKPQKPGETNTFTLDEGFNPAELSFMVTGPHDTTDHSLIILDPMGEEELNKLIDHHVIPQAVKGKTEAVFDSEIAFKDGRLFEFLASDYDADGPEGDRVVLRSGEQYYDMKADAEFVKLFGEFLRKREESAALLVPKDPEFKEAQKLNASFVLWPTPEGGEIRLVNGSEETGWIYNENPVLYGYTGSEFVVLPFKGGSQCVEVKKGTINEGEEKLIPLRWVDCFGKLPRGIYRCDMVVSATNPRSGMLLNRDHVSVYFIIP